MNMIKVCLVPLMLGCSFSNSGGSFWSPQESKEGFDKMWPGFEKAARMNHDRGGRCAIERPASSTYWNSSAVKALARDVRLQFVDVHGCATGLTDEKGRPINRKVRIATNDTLAHHALSLLACPGCERHGWCKARKAKHHDFHTDTFSDAVHKA